MNRPAVLSLALALLLITASRSPAPIQESPESPTSAPEQSAKLFRPFTQADMSKLRAAGYKKHPTPLDAAVKDYVQNYLMTSDYLGAS